MTTVAALNGTFILLKRFQMPRGNHSIDAVSFELNHGGYIHSAYTLMIEFCILQFWSLVVLCGVFFFITKKDSRNHTHNRAAATVGIWNAQASPATSAFLAARYILRMKGDVWYPLMWTCLAAAFIVSSTVSPILLTNYLTIGNVAPVNPDFIFVPDISSSPNIEFGRAPTAETRRLISGAMFSVMHNPATFRAAGSGAVKSESVSVTQEGAGQDLTIKYGYKVTGTDFGLQHLPDLILNVDGSCKTEYSWHKPSENSSTANSYDPITDVYSLFNNPHQNVSVESTDRGAPFATFHRKDAQKDFGKFVNISYAIVINSVQRVSLTPSDDPWYLTTDFTAANQETKKQSMYEYVVRERRPPLSCWETNRWSYRGQDHNIDNLGNLTAGKLSRGLQTTLILSLFPPTIVGIGNRLGRNSLTAGAWNFRDAFDAQQSTILKDMERLVRISHAATVNSLTETTMVQDSQTFGYKNIIHGLNVPGVGDFVVFSPDVQTFSVKTLIVIPVVLVGLLILNLLVAIVPGPWRPVEALHAVIIYSHLHEQATRPQPAVATSPAPAPAETLTRPEIYKRGSYMAYTVDPVPSTIRAEYRKGSGPTWQPTM